MKNTHPTSWNMGAIFLNYLLFSGSDGIFRRRWENCANSQIQAELAISFVVQSLCDGEVQGLSEILDKVVYEVGWSQLAALKLFCV